MIQQQSRTFTNDIFVRSIRFTCVYVRNGISIENKKRYPKKRTFFLNVLLVDNRYKFETKVVFFLSIVPFVGKLTNYIKLSSVVLTIFILTVTFHHA